MPIKKLLAQIKDKQWDQQSGSSTLFFMEHIFGAYIDSDLISSPDLSPLLAYVRGGMFYHFIDDRKLSAIGKMLYHNFLKNKNSFDALIHKHRIATKKLEKIRLRFNAVEYESLSSAQLSILFEKYLKLSHAWWFYSLLLEDKGRMIQEEIVPQFAKRHRMSISEAQEAISVLSHPKELFIYNRERLCFLELCRWVFAHNAINWSREQLEHSREFNKKMQAYMDHFFWFESNFYKYKPVTFEMVYHKIREVLESETIQGITDEINSIWKGVKAIQKSKSTLLKKISLTRIDRNDIYFARRVIEWMEYRKISTMHDVYFITYFMEKCGERLGLSFEEVGFLRKVELLKLLRNKSKPDRIILKKRRAGVILVFNKHQPLQTYHDAQGKKLFAALQHKFDTSRFVVGVVASGVESPTISGRVGVVLDPARDAFRDNDILVTSMTRVEFVPLMKKAKAIVTDEGGIACHAAIVCRELGIPCIIGTKNATKKLKNGDKVTLDLRTGNIYRS